MSVSITRVVLQAKSEGVTQATSDLNNLTQAAVNADKATASLKNSTAALSRAYEAGVASGEKTLALMRQQATIIQSLAGNSRTAANGTEALAAAMALLAASLNIVNLRLQEQTVNQRRANVEMREAQAVARGLSGSLGALWMTYGNFAGMAVGLAIGTSLKGIIVVGKDVENMLENIRVRGGETIEATNKVRDSILKIGEGVYGPQEVAKAFEALTLAGLKAKESTLAIGAALNLATAGGSTIEAAAESLVTIGTAVGATAKSFDYLADGITAAANTSLASVDSISQAVKRASVVNKLYGASFEDILTQTAALAQLGIKNTAAGTAITNFYGNAVGNTEKARKALQDLGMTFTDTEGKAKPLVAAFEEFTSKLNKYDLKSQQNFINDIFGERALRDVEGLRDLVNKSADDTTNYSNKLREVQGQIAEAAGTAALQAAQLGLTTSKQLESVANTLKTSFAKAFEEMGPELLTVTARLKEVFGSQEFINALTSVAAGFSNISMFIVNNSTALGYLLEAFLVFKAAVVGAAIFEAISRSLMGLAATMGAVTVATSGATVATGALGVAMRALPVIGPILTGISIAMALVAFHTGEADEKTKKLADTYNTDFLKALTEEADRLERTNQLMAEGRTESDAHTQSLRDQALARFQLNNQNAIAAAQDKVTASQKDYDVKRIRDFTFDSVNSKEALAYNAALKELNATKKRANEEDQQALTLANKIIFESEQKKAAYKAEQIAKDLAMKEAAGTQVYDRAKEDKAGSNDAYAAALEKINNNIKASKKALQQFEEENNAKFKAGEIGRLEFIQSVGAKEIEEYTIRAKEIQDKIDIASRGKNKKADVARFSGALDSVNTDLENAKVKQANQTAVELARIADENAKYQIAKLESQGKYVEAASKRWENSYSAAFKSAKADFDKFGNKIPEVANRMQQFIELQEQMTNKAQMKKAVAAYDNLYASIANGIKGVQTASEKDGVGAMWQAAQEASEKYKASLPALAQALQAVKDASSAPGASQEDAAKYEEELARQTSLAEKYKTMWTGVGASISKSLGDAFGNAGKATGSIITAMTKYSLDEKKSSESRIKLYGDLAGAAKGYFKEGSTGYKLLEGAEQAFRVVEMANQAKSLVMSLFVSETKAAGAVAGQVVETGAVVAGEAARNTAKVPGVFMSFMSALGPWGAAAAAVAIAAVLGGAFSGGGGGGVSSEERQRTQGTGSVLGDKDAKSESITRALEAIQKDSGLGLVNSNQMVISLKQIVNGIGGLSSLLVRSTDLTSTGSYESLGGVEKFANSAGIFSLGEKLTGGIMSKVLGGIFGGKTTVEDSGISITSSTLENIQRDGVSSNKFVDTKKKGGLFSSDKYRTQTDTLGAEANDQFGMIINGLADTVMSAAKTLGIGGSEFNKRLSTFVVDLGKISLKDKTGEEIQSILESVFSKLGDDMAKFGVQGLKDYQKVGEGYLETLARVTNDYMQVSDVLAVLGKSFNTIGLGAIYLTESLIEAAGDLETLTSGTKFFVDNFLSEAERMGPITNSVNKELTRLGLSTNITSDQFKQLVLQQDLNTIAGQEMYVALLNIAPAFKQAADYAADLADGVVKLSDAQQRALDKIDDARSALDDAYNAQAEGLTSSIDKLKAFADSLKAFQSSLLTGASSPLTAAQKYAQTLANFTTVSAAAKAGDATAQAGFQQAANELLAASKGYNASSQAYTDDFNKVLKVTAELAATTSGKLTDAQAQLDALNKQVEGLLTVNQSVLSVAEAINNLQSAILSGKAQGLTDAQMGVVKVDGSHASGLSYVPKDGYIAELHKGERVLTAKEANSYNSSSSSSDNSELVSEVRNMKEQLAKALSDLAAATVNSNFGAANSAADKTVAALDETMTKVANKCNTIKMN